MMMHGLTNVIRSKGSVCSKECGRRSWQ